MPEGKQPIIFEFPLDRPDGPFTIEFHHVPGSFEEIKPYARQVMNCVREANCMENMRLSEKTIESMGREFEKFLVRLHASSRVRRMIDDRLGRSVRGISDRFSRYASLAEDRVDA